MRMASKSRNMRTRTEDRLLAAPVRAHEARQRRDARERERAAGRHERRRRVLVALLLHRLLLPWLPPAALARWLAWQQRVGNIRCCGMTDRLLLLRLLRRRR